MRWNLQYLLDHPREIPAVKGVYALACVLTGKRYVGSSASGNGFRDRGRRHARDLLAGRHHSRRLQNAFNKYGVQNFEFEILEETTPDNAVTREQFFIELLQACNPSRGFNVLVKASSMLGMRHRPETITKMQRAATGRRISVEARARISAAHKGKKLTAEHKAKVAQAGRGRKWTPAQRVQLVTGLSHPYRLEKDGMIYEGTNISQFCREQGFKYNGGLGAVILGRLRSYHGFRLPGAQPVIRPEYDVISPSGERHHITNLLEFCRAHGLRQGNMWVMLRRGRGTCQGWQQDFAPRLAVGVGFGDHAAETGRF